MKKLALFFAVAFLSTLTSMSVASANVNTAEVLEEDRTCIATVTIDYDSDGVIDHRIFFSYDC
ncbi:MAG: hypothetical protein AAGG75_21665 [Bacteroidota bacterium]